VERGDYIKEADSHARLSFSLELVVVEDCRSLTLPFFTFMAHRLYPPHLLRRAHRDGPAKAPETPDDGDNLFSIVFGDQPTPTDVIVTTPTTTSNILNLREFSSSLFFTVFISNFFSASLLGASGLDRHLSPDHSI
jgi:hypothetical protein